LYTQYRYAWNGRDVGLALAVVGISTSIVSGLLVGPLFAASASAAASYPA